MQEGIVSCSGCGGEYAAEAWRGLPRVTTLSGADVHRHVVGWPEARVVEVRVCRGCGRSMARTAFASPREHLASARERHMSDTSRSR